MKMHYMVKFPDEVCVKNRRESLWKKVIPRDSIVRCKRFWFLVSFTKYELIMHEEDTRVHASEYYPHVRCKKRVALFAKVRPYMCVLNLCLAGFAVKSQFTVGVGTATPDGLEPTRSLW